MVNQPAYASYKPWQEHGHPSQAGGWFQPLAASKAFAPCFLVRFFLLEMNRSSPISIHHHQQLITRHHTSSPIITRQHPLSWLMCLSNVRLPSCVASCQAPLDWSAAKARSEGKIYGKTPGQRSSNCQNAWQDCLETCFLGQSPWQNPMATVEYGHWLINTNKQYVHAFLVCPLMY